MIKSIKVKTSKDIKIEEFVKGKKSAIVDYSADRNETIALATTAFENIILKDTYIAHGYSYKDALPVSSIYNIELTILDKDSTNDLIKALKDGDVAAKKRLLKQLEEL